MNISFSATTACSCWRAARSTESSNCSAEIAFTTSGGRSGNWLRSTGCDMRLPTRSGTESPIKQRPKQLGEPSCRSRRQHPLRHHPPPVQPLEQSLKLRSRQAHHTVLHFRPDKAARLEHLADQHEPGPVPYQNLQPVAPLRAKDHRHPGMRIKLQPGLHDQRQRVRRENSPPDCFLLLLTDRSGSLLAASQS